MESDMKQAMKYMWSNKRMRRSFGCGFELLGNGGMLLIIAVAMAVPLVAKLFGLNVSLTVCRWAYAVAFFGQIMTQVLVLEVPMKIHWLSGKGTGGVPFAKWIMTKGIMVNLLIYYVCSLVLMLGIHGISMVVGAVEVSWGDDILFLIGLFFFLEAGIQVIGGLVDRWNSSGGYYTGIMTAAVVAIPTVMGAIRFSIGMAVLFHVAFMVSGALLMYLHLVRKYQRRSSV